MQFLGYKNKSTIETNNANKDKIDFIFIYLKRITKTMHFEEN